MRKALLTFSLLLSLTFLTVTSVHTQDTPTVMPTMDPEQDISLYDVWLGRANETHPLYWGNHTYLFTGDPVFFVQKGGVHNHAYFHTVWNETVYIDQATNAQYIPWDETHGQVIVHYNETRITLTNGTSFWIPNRVCPLV